MLTDVAQRGGPEDHRHERLPLPHARGRAARRTYLLCISTGRGRERREPHALRERPVLHEVRGRNARGAAATSRKRATPRSRWPSQVRRGAGARLHPAALPLARGRDGGELLPQARAGGPGQALRRPGAARGAGTRRLRDERHRPAGLSRRTSSSCRSTSNGRAARASAWARAVARPQAPSWRTPWTSPPWTRFPNGLLFERFLSPERVEMPDIDVDFEDERRRDEVIEHIKEVYGEDHVSGRHHVRHAAGEERRARRGARTGLPLQHGRPHLQDDRRRAGHHHRQGARDEPRPQEGLRDRRGREAGHRRREVHRRPRARRGRARLCHHHLPRPHEPTTYP